MSPRPRPSVASPRVRPVHRRVALVAAALACAGSPLAAAKNAVKIVPDVEFLEPGRKERLDLYLPDSDPAGRRAPALVWIHGGGWKSGTKTENRAKEICTTLAQAGYVAVSIDYRLGNGAWPQNLHDCKNAVRFLRAHAAHHGLDPQRIAVAGGSAGGHLALMVAFTTDHAGLEPAAPYPGVSSAVRCVINMYGVTNLLTRRKTDPKGTPTDELAPFGSMGVFGAADASDPVLRLGSPVTHVTPQSPPVLILHGRTDATVDYLQAEELAAKLREHGVPHELVLLDNVGHTFAFETWGRRKLPRDLRPTVFAFFDRHLGR